MSRGVHERGPRVFAGLALTQRLGVVAGLVADSFQPGVALSHGGEAIGYAPGSRTNVVIALGTGSGVGCLAPCRLS